MNCIIIDDEPNAIDILKRYAAQTPFLNLYQTFRNPLKAIGYLQEERSIDLIFLDINMPNLTGLQLVKALEKKPLIIFTTAYSEFAVDSYELNAVDYLVKPIEFDRFIKAVNKAKELFQLKNKKQLIPSHKLENDRDKIYVLLKSGAITHKITMNDILFIEKEENYLAFQTTDKKILVRANMNEIFDFVPEDKFFRIHKSFVVALNHIETIEVHQVSIGKHKIPIGSSYRDELLKKIN